MNPPTRNPPAYVTGTLNAHGLRTQRDASLAAARDELVVRLGFLLILCEPGPKYLVAYTKV